MADAPKRPALDIDAFLPYLINVLASRMSRELAAIYEARFNITIAEWRVIAHLAQHRNVSVREVHARVDMDKSKVSRAAATLENAGLIEKRVADADKRLVELQLTRKGRKVFADIEPLALAYEKSALAALSRNERAALRGAIDKLLATPTASPA